MLVFTGLPVRPSHKFGFRSSAAKNGHPEEGRHEGLVPKTMFSQMVSYDFLLHGALHEYFLYLVSAIVSAPPEKPTRKEKLGNWWRIYFVWINKLAFLIEDKHT